MKDKILFIFECVLLLAIVILFVFNAITNDNFFNASMSQLMTLMVAIVIAFWATQLKNDTRKQKEQIENILRKIQTLISHPNFHSINENTVKDDVLITNRAISNYIKLLKTHSKKFKIQNDVEYIEGQFETYKTFISDNIYDFKALENQHITLRKWSENINYKCDQIIFSLYG